MNNTELVIELIDDDNKFMILENIPYQTLQGQNVIKIL